MDPRNDRFTSVTMELKFMSQLERVGQIPGHLVEHGTLHHGLQVEAMDLDALTSSSLKVIQKVSVN